MYLHTSWLVKIQIRLGCRECGASRADKTRNRAATTLIQQGRNKTKGCSRY
jgi:hypothetical protein